MKLYADPVIKAKILKNETLSDPVIKAKILIFSKVSGPKKNTIISIFFLEFCQPSTLNFDPWVEIWTSMGRNLDFHGYCREFPRTCMTSKIICPLLSKTTQTAQSTPPSVDDSPTYRHHH